jgi:hypothetical protein
MQTQIFGNIIESFSPDQDSLELSFTPNSQRIKQRWKNHLLSAQFVADYFTNFLPLDINNPDDDERRIKEAKSAISYVANELIENAMKFHNLNSKNKVKLGIRFIQTDEIRAAIYATNSIDCMAAEKFQGFIQELLASDPEEFFMQQIEASAEDENAEMSGLGFITMINDYQASLGWKFELLATDSNALIVTAMAQIVV